MATQGFMGKISRWFGGASDTYFFGLLDRHQELWRRQRCGRALPACWKTPAADSSNVDEKRRLIRRFLALLEESELFWTYGYWGVPRPA